MYLLCVWYADSSCANYAVMHGLCAMTKQQYAARTGSPYDNELADSWKFTELYSYFFHKLTHLATFLTFLPQPCNQGSLHGQISKIKETANLTRNADF